MKFRQLGLRSVALPLAAAVITTLTVAPAIANDDESSPTFQRGRGNSDYVPPAGATFSRPGDGKVQKLILDNIENTPEKAYIRGVSWTFTSQTIADALLKAESEGVVVRLLISRRSRDEPPVNQLQEALGSSCSPGNSCIKVINYSARGSNMFDGTHTTLHQKSWQFSTSGSKTDVSIVTSSNATNEARDHQFTDAYVFVENGPVYDLLRDTFVEQSKDDGGANPFEHHEISATVALDFSPWNSPAMADPVVRRIQALPANNLTIRVANSAWRGARGAAIAHALAAKASQGAKIFVLASEPFGADVRGILSRAGIPIHDGYFSANSYHHLKFMTARWGTGDGVKTRVWTGSENWADDSRGNDELVLRVGAGGTHTDYVNFFNSIYN